MTWLYWVLGVPGTYLLISLFSAYWVHRFPRNPVRDPPDWGSVTDVRIPATDGGSLEVWRVDPEGPSRGVVLLVHGWGRNRDRMVARARIFGRLGFTAVMHSARDHGRSSPYRFMNPARFAEDVETVIHWVGEPVLLYGHSAGAAGAILVAGRNPHSVRLLFLEGCYAHTTEGLRRLYGTACPLLGPLFAPMVVLWMDLFYGFGLDDISPERVAPAIDLPVLIVHGERDQNFPLDHAWRLRDRFPAGRAELFVGRDADHSSSSLTREFPGAVESFVNRHLRLIP